MKELLGSSIATLVAFDSAYPRILVRRRLIQSHPTERPDVALEEAARLADDAVARAREPLRR
jgi:hypothetical protein